MFGILPASKRNTIGNELLSIKRCNFIFFAWSNNALRRSREWMIPVSSASGLSNYLRSSCNIRWNFWLEILVCVGWRRGASSKLRTDGSLADLTWTRFNWLEPVFCLNQRKPLFELLILQCEVQSKILFLLFEHKWDVQIRILHCVQLMLCVIDQCSPFQEMMSSNSCLVATIALCLLAGAIDRRSKCHILGISSLIGVNAQARWVQLYRSLLL